MKNMSILNNTSYHYLKIFMWTCLISAHSLSQHLKQSLSESLCLFSLILKILFYQIFLVIYPLTIHYLSLSIYRLYRIYILLKLEFCSELFLRFILIDPCCWKSFIFSAVWIYYCLTMQWFIYSPVGVNFGSYWWFSLINVAAMKIALLISGFTYIKGFL